MWSSRSSAASSPIRVEAVAHCHRPVLTHPFWEVITFTWLTGTLHTLFIVVTIAIHPFGKAMSTPFILLKHTKVHNVVYNSAVIQRKHYCQRLSDQTRLYKFVISLSVDHSTCRLWQEYYGLAERSDLIWHCKIWRKYSENTSLKENRGTSVCLDQWSSYLTELRSSGNLCNLTHIGGEAPPKVIQQIGLVSTIIIILFHLHGSHQLLFVYQNFSTWPQPQVCVQFPREENTEELGNVFQS